VVVGSEGIGLACRTRPTGTNGSSMMVALRLDPRSRRRTRATDSATRCQARTEVLQGAAIGYRVRVAESSVMTSSNLIRLGGLAAMVAGVYALKRYWRSSVTVPVEKQDSLASERAPVNIDSGLAKSISALAVYPRHRLDIVIQDLLFGLTACIWASRRRRLAAEVAKLFPPSENALVCLSVRSGFDLLLGTLAVSPGDEVLVSAVTHPDMVRIIQGHGLRVIPVDLDAATLEPRVELFERALSPRTRAVLVAHLFGGRFDLDPVVAFARRHDLLLIEDCAQAFSGPPDVGDTKANVSMFSFGPIKTASAAGGAVLCVRDAGLLRKMRHAQDRWHVQSRFHYAGRLVKALCLVLLERPLAYGLLVRLCALSGRDLDELVNGAIRAFPASGAADGDLFKKVRRQPSAPLLALLARRLRTFDASRLARRAAVGEHLARHLSPTVRHPGGLAAYRTHWLFPVEVSDPGALVVALRRRRFDASRVTSSIAPVPAPADLSRCEPESANRMMSHIVFLPAYPELPKEDLDRLARAVKEIAADGCEHEERA
jgi:perosamine synthetase